MKTKDYIREQVKSFIYDPEMLNKNIINPDTKREKEICVENVKIIMNENRQNDDFYNFNFILKPFNCSDDEVSRLFSNLEDVISDIFKDQENCHITGMENHNMITCRVDNLSEVLELECEEAIVKTQIKFDEENLEKKETVLFFYESGEKDKLLEVLDKKSTYKIYDHGSVIISR